MNILDTMSSKTALNRAVKQWMGVEKLTQASVASMLGISQSVLSKRLRGELKWSIDDVDALEQHGAPVSITTYYLDEED